MTPPANRALLRRLTPEQRHDVKEAVAYAYLYGTPPMECLRSLPHRLSAFEIRVLYHQCIEADGEGVVKCRCGKSINHRGVCNRGKSDPRTGQISRVRPIPDNEIDTMCPCCGNGMHSQFLAVDLNTNTIGYQNRAWRMPPQMAVFAHKLIEGYPKAVESYDMRIAIWGAIDGPDHDDGAIKMYASVFRRFLRESQIDIELLRGGRSGSYVLKKREVADRVLNPPSWRERREEASHDDRVDPGDHAVRQQHGGDRGHLNGS